MTTLDYVLSFLTAAALAAVVLLSLRIVLLVRERDDAFDAFDDAFADARDLRAYAARCEADSRRAQRAHFLGLIEGARE